MAAEIFKITHFQKTYGSSTLFSLFSSQIFKGYVKFIRQEIYVKEKMRCFHVTIVIIYLQ